MKLIRLYIILAICTSTSVYGQNITLSLENAQITNDGTDDFYEVDVYISSDVEYTQGSGQFLFNYNELAFGTNVELNGNIEYVRPLGSILRSQTFGVDNYNQIVTNDNTPTRTGILWQQFWSAGTIGTNITPTPTLLVHINLRFIDSSITPDACFDTTTPFDDQFFTACGPFTPVPAGADCLAASGIQIFDYSPDCTGGVISCLDIAVWTAGGWDISPLVPTSSTNVTIMADYDTSIVGANIDACKLTIDTGASVIVAQGDYIKVGGDIVVNAGSLLKVAHTGNLVQVDDTAMVTNNGTINVELTTPALNARDFMILGSPMTAEDNAVFTGAYQVLNHTTDNFTPYVGVPPVVGVNFHDQEFNDWTDYTGTINAGEGYLVRPSYIAGGTYNYVYDQGTLNNGEVTYNAEFGDNKEDSPNVLSNPYASAMDAELFINSNPIIDELYFWEHITTPNGSIPGPLGENFSMEDVSTYNGLMGLPASSGVGAPNGGSVPNGIIATGQGFGIKANLGGDVTFNNSMRLTSGNITLRLTDDKDLLWLAVRENTYGMGNTAGIGFTENGTPGLDESFDTMKLGTVVSLYSHLLDGSEQLGIQGREAFDASITIPMGFSTLIEADAGIPYVISIDKLEGVNIEQVTIYLIDHLFDVTTNLSTDRYEFLSDAGTFDNRFTLQFEPLVLAINNPLQPSVSVFPNPTEDFLNIVSPNSDIDLVEIYDIRGRIIKRKVFSSEEDYQVDLSLLESAVYFLKVSTSKGIVTKRIVKR